MPAIWCHMALFYTPDEVGVPWASASTATAISQVRCGTPPGLSLCHLMRLEPVHAVHDSKQCIGARPAHVKLCMYITRGSQWHVSKSILKHGLACS